MKNHTAFIQLLYSFHITFIQFSYNFCTTFVQLLYNFYTTFIPQKSLQSMEIQRFTQLPPEIKKLRNLYHRQLACHYPAETYYLPKNIISYTIKTIETHILRKTIYLKFHILLAKSPSFPRYLSISLLPSSGMVFIISPNSPFSLSAIAEIPGGRPFRDR